MTREQKILKRKARAKLRAEKRNNEYRSKIYEMNDRGIPTQITVGMYKRGTNSWYDSNSSTGYSRMCEMGGRCESPCNGDC